MAFAQIVALKD